MEIKCESTDTAQPVNSCVIVKDDSTVNQANMPDYEGQYASFSWEAEERSLDGLPGGGLNVAHEAVDRHVLQGAGEQRALRWLSVDGRCEDFSYDELRRASNRFAGVLQALGVQKGERVYTLLGRVPELYITALGTFKAGCVFCPLFSAFGPEPVHTRLDIGQGSVLVTTKRLHQRKVASIRSALPALSRVLLVDTDADDVADTLAFHAQMDAADDEFDIVSTKPEDPALLHFTSGTTGTPKGALHVHHAVLTHCVTGRLALDIRPNDIYWCTADPGWVTGTSYGIIAPLANRATLIIDEAEFNAHRWYHILESEKVAVWYTAPTAVRLLMKAGSELPADHDLSQLRFLASVGEPLNPEAVRWSQEVFGKAFHDNWWQTETGGIMIANYAAMAIKSGSMGKPVPGIQAGILERTDTGYRDISASGAMGELALKVGWPSMMQAYIHEEARYRKCFYKDWYLSGDLARRDADGYFWFVGRGDDLIKSAGHLIGPFEVESALMEHEAVAEAGVIGIPHPDSGEVVKAFVALKPGYEPCEDLRLLLLGHARSLLGPAVAPKQIAFRGSLPKTRSGKIMRRLLKARELGLPEGDTTTLARDEA